MILSSSFGYDVDISISGVGVRGGGFQIFASETLFCVHGKFG